MKVKIEIECSTYMEVMQHLFVIKRDLKRKLKKESIRSCQDLMDNCAEKKYTLTDDNCYAGSYFRIFFTDFFKLFGVEINAIGQCAFQR